MEPLTSWRTSALRRAPSHSGADARPLHARPADAHARAWPRAGLPIAAAAATFAAAFAIGMATKSSSSRQPATSLAPPVAIQAPSASVPALQPGVPTPALKPRPAPHHPPKTRTGRRLRWHRRQPRRSRLAQPAASPDPRAGSSITRPASCTTARRRIELERWRRRGPRRELIAPLSRSNSRPGAAGRTRHRARCPRSVISTCAFAYRCSSFACAACASDAYAVPSLRKAATIARFASAPIGPG